MRRKGLFLVIIIFMLSSCGYDSFSDWDVETDQAPTPNASISDLVTLSSEDQLLQVNINYVIEGVVVSEDKASNFYKSLVIDDGAAGLEIMVGLYDLSNLYPVGSKVVVSTLDLYLGVYDGVTQLGTTGYSYVGYMGHKVVADKYITLTEQRQSVTALDVEISELNANLCGRFVKIDNLTWSKTDSDNWTSVNSYTESVMSTYTLFTDQKGNKIYVYVSSYADFASESVPSAELSICGILYYGDTGGSGNSYYLKIRSLDDVETY